ncbi:MAG: hypothetical protein NC541_15395 [bacterium]|nr:hypothetical protein [bacterium]
MSRNTDGFRVCSQQDLARVTIGDYVMIGPNTLITTVGHSLTPMGGVGILGSQGL